MSLSPDFNRPAFDATAADEDLDQLRENIWFVLCLAAQGALWIPGWGTTLPDETEPSYVELVRNSGSPKLKIDFTYDADGNPVTAAASFDKGLGAGYEAIPNGTATFTFSASGNLTGISTA